MRTVADVVAANVARLRNFRGLSVRGLSEQLGRLGHPILASGLSKIENGERKVTVADLVALALALGVSPVRLLLPGADERDESSPGALLEPSREPVALVDGGELVPWDRVWRWACGDAPLVEYAPEDLVRWLRLNRPHDDGGIVAAYVAAVDADPAWSVERDECGRPTQLVGPGRRWDSSTGPDGEPVTRRNDVPPSLPPLRVERNAGVSRGERQEAP